MHYLLRVKEVKSLENTLDNFADVLLRKLFHSPLVNYFEKVVTRNVLHHQMNMAFVLESFEILYYIWMIELAENIHFVNHEVA